MDNHRLETLLHLYLDEGLDEETKSELEQILLSSSQARAIFWERAKLNAMLRQLGQESWGKAHPLIELPLHGGTGNRAFGAPQVFFLAGSCLLAIALSWWAFAVTQANKGIPLANQPAMVLDAGESPSQLQRPTWVAIVRKTVDAQWATGERPLNEGEAMSACRIRLEGGLVEIQTSRGALLTLQGPADLKIVSEMEVLCLAGRLRVDVPPPAIGFVVNTPHIDVVDLGTSFAVDVRSQDETEVHVLEGKVELASKSLGMPLRELVQGQSVGVTGGSYRDIISGRTLMPSASQVQSKSRIAEARFRESWKRRNEAIMSDPSCLVYFDFEDASRKSVTLVNKANARPERSNATIVGCEWAEGRWPGKRALDFNRHFDRILFDAAGEHDALTCMASVRLDSMDSSVVPLLMPFESFENAIRWQMVRPTTTDSLTQLQFGRRTSERWHTTQRYTSSAGLRPEQLSTWIQLAVVWDGKRQVCSQYVDGVLVSQETIHPSEQSESLTVRTNRLEFGNSTFSGIAGGKASSHFVGRIDELAMFDRALSADEINTFHDLKKITWTNSNEDGNWNDPRNWSAAIDPMASDAVYIDRVGRDAAIYAEGKSPNLNEIRVGSMAGLHGELRITGGTLTAEKFSNANSRIGVAGGQGTVVQEDGSVRINSLQVGLDERSRGDYLLEGGDFVISRAVEGTIGSLDVGAKGGVGTFTVRGGSLRTRRGVSLGREMGLGEFIVDGSRPNQIAIGAHSSGDGFWIQNPGSTLQVMIDDQGLTPIVIHQVDEALRDGPPCRVTFEKDALFDVNFSGKPRSGTWDVMRCDGKFIDKGLAFSPKVDRDVWQFEFVDTNESGTPDTLRVSAKVAVD